MKTWNMLTQFFLRVEIFLHVRHSSKEKGWPRVGHNLNAFWSTESTLSIGELLFFYFYFIWCQTLTRGASLFVLFLFSKCLTPLSLHTSLSYNFFLSYIPFHLTFFLLYFLSPPTFSLILLSLVSMSQIPLYYSTFFSFLFSFFLLSLSSIFLSHFFIFHSLSSHFIFFLFPSLIPLLLHLYSLM